MWGGLTTTYAIYDFKFTFEAGLFNDDEEYQVILSPSSADVASQFSNRIMSIEVNTKNYQFFEVRTYVWEDTANYLELSVLGLEARGAGPHRRGEGLADFSLIFFPYRPGRR